MSQQQEAKLRLSVYLYASTRTRSLARSLIHLLVRWRHLRVGGKISRYSVKSSQLYLLLPTKQVPGKAVSFVAEFFTAAAASTTAGAPVSQQKLQTQQHTKRGNKILIAGFSSQSRIARAHLLCYNLLLTIYHHYLGYHCHWKNCCFCLL